MLARTADPLSLSSIARIPSLPANLPAIQKLAAQAAGCVVYAMLLARPMLGILHTNAGGRRIDSTFRASCGQSSVPTRSWPSNPSRCMSSSPILILALVPLHAADALFHHFVRRDNVLNAMLPPRLRRVGRSGFALGGSRRQT